MLFCFLHKHSTTFSNKMPNETRKAFEQMTARTHCINVHYNYLYLSSWSERESDSATESNE